MFKYKALKYGILLSSTSAAAYYWQDINDSLVGAVRFGRAAVTVGQVAWDYNRSLYSRKIDVSSKEYAKVTSEVHLRSAKKLLKLCETNGGAFIKVGQHLGALDYLIPFEYVHTLRVLHDHAPTSKYEDILDVIHQDLKCEPSTVFQNIEREPIGSASLAQVHKANLLDGTVVAVKVQHPLVKAYSTVDMKSMEILVGIVSWMFPDFKLQWLVEETKRNLPCELNFVMEGQNAEKTAGLMKHLPWLHVPKVFWDFSTSRVLTMEFCSGLNIGDLAKDQNTKLEPFKSEISNKVTRLFSDMIFLHGYVHCDPHPGNIKVDLNSKGEVVIHLLDHGLYTQLPTEFRENYAKLWTSIIRSDVKAIEAYGRELGVAELYGLFACMITGRSWNAILGGIDKHQKTTSEAKEIKDDASKYLKEIMEVLHRVPREMLLIFKTNDLLRCLDSMLGIKSNTSSFVVMSRSCANANYLKEISESSSLASKWRAKFTYYLTHLSIIFYRIFLWWLSIRSPNS